MLPLPLNSSTMVGIDPSEKEKSWKDVSLATGNILTPWGIEILRNGLDDDVGSVFVEDAYICKDYRNLHTHFYSKKFKDRSSRCSRLHFFNQTELTVNDLLLHPEDLKKHYMGYSVIEPVSERCLGRTVIDPRRLSSLNSAAGLFCLGASFPVRIMGTGYEVHGFPYRSQSAEATVCAHTVLWSICRYLSQKYSIYGELLPYDFIERVGGGNGRRVPNRGMTYADYSEIFHSFGCHPSLMLPRNTEKSVKGSWTKDAETFYDMYAYLESGFPLVTSFSGHVVSVIGHTLQSTPRTDHPISQGPIKFLNSAAFLDSYVIVDDNFFPYRQLRYLDEPQYHSGAFGAINPCIDNIYSAVIPLPEKVFLRPGDCRDKTYETLRTDEELLKLISETRRSLGDVNIEEPVIARQFLTAGAAFKRRKREQFIANPDKLLQLPIEMSLPHFIWVIELLIGSSVAKRQAFAEIVVDATQGLAEWDPIYVRIGKTSLVSSTMIRDNSASTEFGQFIHNLGVPE